MDNQGKYPYYIFTTSVDIPYLQNHSIKASTYDIQNTHVLGITDFYGYIYDIQRLELDKQLGILPPGIVPYARTFYFKNQRIRWAFKRLLYLYNRRKASKQIFNTECLGGEPIEYKQSISSRRILCLWDMNSKRSYLYRIDDILGILRASILGDEIHTPKNPYTNLPFTSTQIREIHLFLQANMDRILPTDAPMMTYTRWESKELTYDHIDQIRYARIFNINRVPESMIVSMLWNRILNTDSLPEDKKAIANEIRSEFLKQSHHTAVTQVKCVPTTKIGYYVRTQLLDGEDTNGISAGKRLKWWHLQNRIRYRVGRNHPHTE